jgi:hypothetical protein
MPSCWPQGKDRIKSLPPCFQKYISQNPAWEGKNLLALSYTFPH